MPIYDKHSTVNVIPEQYPAKASSILNPKIISNFLPSPEKLCWDTEERNEWSSRIPLGDFEMKCKNRWWRDEMKIWGEDLSDQQKDQKNKSNGYVRQLRKNSTKTSSLPCKDAAGVGKSASTALKMAFHVKGPFSEHLHEHFFVLLKTKHNFCSLKERNEVQYTRYFMPSSGWLKTPPFMASRQYDDRWEVPPLFIVIPIKSVAALHRILLYGGASVVPRFSCWRNRSYTQFVPFQLKSSWIRIQLWIRLGFTQNFLNWFTRA